MTATVEPDTVGGRKRLTKFIQQTRFAQSRVANDRHGLSASSLGERETVPQQRQFTLPPHQAREATLARHVNPRTGTALTGHPVCTYPLCHPLDADRPQIIAVKVASHQLIGVFGKLN